MKKNNPKVNVPNQNNPERQESLGRRGFDKDMGGSSKNKAKSDDEIRRSTPHPSTPDVEGEDEFGDDVF